MFHVRNRGKHIKKGGDEAEVWAGGWKQRGSGGGGGGGGGDGGKLEPARRNASDAADTGPLQSTSTNTHQSS